MTALHAPPPSTPRELIMNFSTLKVSTRLTLGFASAVLLALAIAATGTVQMRRMAAEVDELANDRMPKVEKFTHLKDNLNTIARTARNVIIIHDPAIVAAEMEVIR